MSTAHDTTARLGEPDQASHAGRWGVLAARCASQITSCVLVIGAVAAGMARGVFTLVQATAVTDRWGRRYHGHLTSLLSAAISIAMALAPFAGAALAGLLGSYATTFLILGVLATIATALSFLTIPQQRQHLS